MDRRSSSLGHMPITSFEDMNVNLGTMLSNEQILCPNTTVEHLHMNTRSYDGFKGYQGPRVPKTSSVLSTNEDAARARRSARPSRATRVPRTPVGKHGAVVRVV